MIQDTQLPVDASKKARSMDHRGGYDFGEDEGGALLIGRDLCCPTCPFTELDPNTLLIEIQQAQQCWHQVEETSTAID